MTRDRPTPSQESTPDHGADLGPAMQARERRREVIEGRAAGSIRTVRIEVTRFVDCTVYDAMHARGQLSTRQKDAAERLHAIWSASGLDGRVTANLPVAQEEVEDAMEIESEENPDPDAEPIDRLRDIMGEMPHRLIGPVTTMLQGNHPGIRQLADLQDGLTWLADLWGLDAEGST